MERENWDTIKIDALKLAIDYENLPRPFLGKCPLAVMLVKVEKRPVRNAPFETKIESKFYQTPSLGREVHPPVLI